MTKIVDLRGDSRIMGPTNPNRSVAGITKIARHHSATATVMYGHSKITGEEHLAGGLVVTTKLSCVMDQYN